MQSLARNGYTPAAVDTALHAPNRIIYFRYELLDKTNQFKANLTNVISASVANNSLSQIKRTARFTLRDDGAAINFLSDRIKPYVQIIIPAMQYKYSDFNNLTYDQMRSQTYGTYSASTGIVEFPLGVFVLSTPPRKAEATGKVTREVDAYDQLQILVDDKVVDRYSITAGTNYISAVKTLLDGAGVSSQNLTATSSTLPAARDWDPGTPKLQIINDLLGAVNYRSLFFDEDGMAVATPYVSPSQRASEYTYADDSNSVIFPQMDQAYDLFGIPNKWVLVVSQPDRPPLSSVYTNSNPSSPTSTVNRGRTITDFRNNQDAVDQTTLDALAQREAFEASQVYETVDFETAIMPHHSDSDVYTLTFSTLGISAKYSEMSWQMELKAGGHMKHQIRRVVSV